MTIKIMPCPFCGSEAELYKVFLHKFIACKSKTCSCHIEKVDIEDLEIIKLWNTRAQSTIGKNKLREYASILRSKSGLINDLRAAKDTIAGINQMLKEVDFDKLESTCHNAIPYGLECTNCPYVQDHNYNPPFVTCELLDCFIDYPNKKCGIKIGVEEGEL